MTCILTSAQSLTLGKLGGGGCVPPLEAKGEGRSGKVLGRAANRRVACLMGGNLSGQGFPRKPRTDRQTDTQTTEHPGLLLEKPRHRHQTE